MLRPPLTSPLFPYTTLFRSFYHRIDDIIDIVPIGEDGQSIGNLPRATRIGGEFTSTINFDPIGWTGAKLEDRKSTRLNSSHLVISYAVFCLKKKNKKTDRSN